MTNGFKKNQNHVVNMRNIFVNENTVQKVILCISIRLYIVRSLNQGNFVPLLNLQSGLFTNILSATCW